LDTSRLSQGELIAGVSGLALLVVMFLPWYGVDFNFGGVSDSETVNAWEVFSWIDILLFLAALAAVGSAVVKLADVDLPDVPVAAIVAGLGAVAVLLVVYRVIDTPGPDIPQIIENNIDFGRKFGLFLGLIAAGGVAYGGYRQMSEAPQPAQPAPPAEPPAEPPAVPAS
jgi:hypothetical protein